MCASPVTQCSCRCARYRSTKPLAGPNPYGLSTLRAVYYEVAIAHMGIGIHKYDHTRKLATMLPCRHRVM